MLHREDCYAESGESNVICMLTVGIHETCLQRPEHETKERRGKTENH